MSGSPVATSRLLHGDAATVLATLPARSVRCCVTSPPYFGLRSYLDAAHADKGQEVGTEETPDAYVARLVDVFRAVRRVLTDDGTLWLNLGDGYAANRSYQVSDSKHQAHDFGGSNATKVPNGCKPKDLLGIPWLVAFALRADGWYLRSSIIWAKPNAMPESVRDRPTKSHETIFLLSKQAKYYYDADAVREPHQGITRPNFDGTRGTLPKGSYQGIDRCGNNPAGRNKRDVWTIPTRSYKAAHFATFPEALVEPCILAGSAAGDTVIDPFAGSGTAGAVALRHGRRFVGIDLNASYLELAQARIGATEHAR